MKMMMDEPAGDSRFSSDDACMCLGKPALSVNTLSTARNDSHGVQSAASVVVLRIVGPEGAPAR